MSASIVIKWDRAPVRQAFGACNVVFDGVATVNGKSYRINGIANRACRKIEIALRYLSPVRRGHIVPVSMLHDVRMAAMQSAAELLAPMRAEYVAKAQAADAAYMSETVSAPIKLRQLRGPDGQSVLAAAPVDDAAWSKMMDDDIAQEEARERDIIRSLAEHDGCELIAALFDPSFPVTGDVVATTDSDGRSVLVPAPVVDKRARVAANIAALSAPVVACRPHPIPFATVGDLIDYKKGRLSGKAVPVLEVATGIGWPCYRISPSLWIGHESLTANPVRSV